MKKGIILLAAITLTFNFTGLMLPVNAKTQNVKGMTETVFNEQKVKNALDENDYFSMVEHYFLEHNYSKAVELAQNGIKEFPHSYMLYNLLGLSYENMKDKENAIISYTKSIEIKPTEPPYYNRGKLYGSLGQFEKAISDFTKAIDLVSEYKNDKDLYQERICDIYWYRAMAYSEMGEYLKAVKDYDSILRILPSGNPDVYKYRAMTKISVCANDSSIPDSERNIIFNSVFEDLDNALKGYREADDVKSYQETFELNKILLNTFTKMREDKLNGTRN